MKTTRQRKGKTVDAPKRRSRVGCAGVKKSTNRTGGRHQATSVGCKYISVEDDPGVFSFSHAQVEVQQLPMKHTLSQQMTKAILKPEGRIGLHLSEKIKLQLFPINEGTKIGLEKDGHNPYLELTVRARKKISSVLKHLNSNWGNSSVAIGDPMLFPYNIQLENLSTYKRWTLNDTGIHTGDVYAAIESPAVFRLRYGWFLTLEPKTTSRSTHIGACFESGGFQKGCSAISELMDDKREKLQMKSEDFNPIKSKAVDAVVTNNTSLDVPVDCGDNKVPVGNGLAQSVVPWEHSLTNLNIEGLLSDVSLQGKISICRPKSESSKLNLQPIQLISSEISIGGLLSEASLQGRIDDHVLKSNGSELGLQPTMDHGLVHSSVPWDDSLTTFSIGGLLSEASLLGKIASCVPNSKESKLGLQSTPLISDSLDAFIAGRLNSQSQESKSLAHASHSSILDAEETCHAFPFRKLSSSGKDAVFVGGSATPMGHNHHDFSKSFNFFNIPELNGQGELAQDSPFQESKTSLSTHLGVTNDENSLGLAGIKWTESLGPFDVVLSTSRQMTSADSVSISEFVR